MSRLGELRARIAGAKFADEDALVASLAAEISLDDGERAAIEREAAGLVEGVRSRRDEQSVLDAFMQEFGLANDEGVALMCLAESLLRVPDGETSDDLIADKLADRDWREHLGESSSLFVNAGTLALMLTGQLVEPPGRGFGDALSRVLNRVSEPVVRTAMRQAMRILGAEFVLGRSIDEAARRGREEFGDGAVFSFDMLGEGARTYAAAQHYFENYRRAIDAVGAMPRTDEGRRSSVSVKLSALHPRYEPRQHRRVETELGGRLRALAIAAHDAGVDLAIDAEEADRLELSLDLFTALAMDPALDGWHGLSFVVQAYGRRAGPLIDWLAELARTSGRQIPVRLVKGAYWDAEIKHAQESGYPSFPVFTRKPHTDVSYLACAGRLFAHAPQLVPQFATHNAHTLVAVRALAQGREFEYQRLHGMGELLYQVARDADPTFAPTRIYAPVGGHEDLLAYLVRRLLENGANSSFVNRFLDESLDPMEVVRDPQSLLQPGVPLVREPADLFNASATAPARVNSLGADLSDPDTRRHMAAVLEQARDQQLLARPIIDGEPVDGAIASIHSPANGLHIGTWHAASAAECERAMACAVRAQPQWDAQPAEARARVLETAADLLEAARERFYGLLVHEAGKTLPDCIAEVREAIDFLRYYAGQSRRLFGEPQTLPGPTGELDQLRLRGRGVFVCISPWNFPLAIFLGQVGAALAAGNAVVAKPAEQTPAVAGTAVALLHEAGVPPGVLHLALGAGSDVGQRLVDHPATAGVAFTGGTDTARRINRSLAARDGPLVPLIAETGGQNAMIVDTTALLEQVTDDVVESAFYSAGQRCSALRVLYLQEQIADRALDMIRGAMDALVVGPPASLATDVGPIIDQDALARLEEHVARSRARGRLLHQVSLNMDGGWFMAPTLLSVDGIAELDAEHFGPVLHVARFAASDFERVIESVNGSGYGLTLGLHTRIDERVRMVKAKARVGNLYVNRNMIGAVVGVQPFGGEGLSGTGPKAGGPNYLTRFAVERTVSVNTMATGGNVELLRRELRTPPESGATEEDG